MNQEESENDKLFRDWAELKKLQRPEHWNRMVAMIRHRQKRRRLTLILRYVAAIFVFALGICLVFFFWNPNAHDRSSIDLASVPECGSYKAILRLSNGNIVDLSTDTTTFSENDGTRINNNHLHGITYLATTRKNEKNLLNTLEVPQRGEFNLTLSDGTKVWLNSCSKLVYPVAFAGDSTREVFLEGEAYFDVASISGRKFVVKTADYSIQVLGTSFNVMAYKEDGFSHTTLKRGKIRICYENEVKNLQPGEQAVLRDGIMTVKEVNTAYYTEWMTERFYFDTESMENIMRKLQRWYGIRVEFKNEDVKNLHFVGSIPKYSSIAEVCRIIALTTDINFTFKDGLLFIF